MIPTMQSASPTISIIVPVYNVEPWIGATLESIKAQTFADFEVIMVDDGSTDNSADICTSFINKDRRFKLIKQSNCGPSIARNSGIKIAEGKYITFVDSDDLIHPEYLSILHKAITNADISFCSFKAFSVATPPKKAKINYTVKLLDTEDVVESILYQNRHNNGINASAWGKLFKAELWQNHRFPDNYLYEDLDSIPIIVASSKKIAIVDAPLYYYRIREGSILDVFSPKRLQVIEVCQRLIRQFSENQRLMNAAEDRLLSAAFNMYILLSKDKNLSSDFKEREMSRCLKIIRRYRMKSLMNKRVRLKNKIGIILSFFPGLAIIKHFVTMSR